MSKTTLWVLTYRPAGSVNFENHVFDSQRIAQDTLRQWKHNWSGEGHVQRATVKLVAQSIDSRAFIIPGATNV